MAESLFRGPVVGIGAIMDGRPESYDGPSIDYQGGTFPDPRFFPANKDSLQPAVIRSYFNAPSVVVVDTIPSASSTTTIAAAQAPSTTAGVALSLTTAVLGTAAGVPVWAPGIPILPFGSGSISTVSAIDFGFATGTTVAASSTVIVNDNSLFAPGQWIIIAGVGAGGATNTPLFTQVQTKSTNTTIITIFPVAATAVSHAPIGQANLHGATLTPPATQFVSAATPNAAEPWRGAGFASLFNSYEGSARALSVTAASIGSGTTAVLVTGFDVFGTAMTEVITANGTNIVNGLKAFKYISSVKVQTAATTVTPANITIGVSDVFGVNLRSDRWEYLNIKWNGCIAPTSAGWTAALSTTSTNTTADVRGTVNASTLAIASVASTNGARRLTIIQSVPMYNMINASPIATTSLFGTPQA